MTKFAHAPRLLALLPALLLGTATQALDATPGVKVTPLIKTTTSWNGAPIHFPAGTAEISAITIEIAPGGETGWHLHPVPSFGTVVEGTLDVQLKDGSHHVFKQGDVIVEVVDTLHNGRNVGEGPLKLLVFYAGATDKPLTVRP